jgi:hypothetical protein
MEANSSGREQLERPAGPAAGQARLGPVIFDEWQAYAEDRLVRSGLIGTIAAATRLERGSPSWSKRSSSLIWGMGCCRFHGHRVKVF